MIGPCLRGVLNREHPPLPPRFIHPPPRSRENNRLERAVVSTNHPPMDGRVFAPFLNERVALIRVLYTLHTFARYNRKELAAIATSFRSFVSGKVFSTAGTKAEFFPLSSSFFLLFLPVELSFREESGSTRLENKQSYNFSPRAFFQTFVRLRVILCNASHGRTSASISTLPSCDTGSHPSIAPEHPQLRGSLLPSFSQVFSFRGGTIKVNDLYASFIRLTLKTSRESTDFLSYSPEALSSLENAFTNFICLFDS